MPGPTEADDAHEGDLGSLGLDAETEALYRLVLRCDGESLDSLSDRTGVPVAQMPARLQPLLGLRLVRVVEGRVSVEPPDLALGRLVAERTRTLRREEDRLTAVRTAIPDLVSAHDQARSDDWVPVPVEAIESGDLVDTMETLVRNSTGELLFFRPDQFSLPSGQRMDEVVIRVLRDGRSSRTLYPASIGDDVPERVRLRSAAGERVRVVPVVPARMAVFGRQALVVSEHWDSPVGRRIVVRQPALVAAAVTLFDSYWDRGVTVPGLGRPEDAGPEELVALLARGAKDEQIARLLGLSLRTVRRRIAALMHDLGVESRFQAGMEAVRRGLL